MPDLTWAANIAGLEDDEIQANLKGLPVERQAELVLALGWADRLRVILNSDRAGDLVKALPREEVFLTLKAVDEEDGLPVLALTSPEQLRFILDIELWNKGLIDEDRVVAWLHSLLACGETKVAEFVRTSDPELLTLVMRKLVCLVPNEEGVAIPEGLPSIMPDEFFTILSKLPEETENIGLLLRILRQMDRNFFYALLFQVHGASEDETLETALRWRDSRLEESGFLDFDEAIEIYGYIGEEDARTMARVPPGVYGRTEAAVAPAPTFPALLVERRTFFYDVIRSIEDSELRDRLRRDIAFTLNRLLVADAENIGDLESIRQALARLFGLVNVGLLFLTDGGKDDAVGVLRDLPLRDLFQIGFSRLTDLKRRAADLARRFWPEWRAQGFGFLYHPLDEVMKGLMMRVPQYYVLPTAAGAGLRDFETMDEVGATRRALEEIEVVAEVCFDRIGIPRPHQARLELAKVFAVGLEDITLRSVVLTGFVNLIVRGDFDFSPLTPSEVEGLFERVLEPAAQTAPGTGAPPQGRRTVRAEARLALLGYLARTSGYEGPKLRMLESFADASLREMEEEVGGVSSWQHLDPRYVRTLIFQRGAQDKGSRSGKGA
jgi:hypothetical protein